MSKNTGSPSSEPAVENVVLSFDSALDCQSPILISALAYWRGLLNTRTMPAPADIDALEVPRAVLPHVGLVDVEYEPEKRFRWRLIGTAITTTLQRDISGRYWSELYGEDEFCPFYPPLNTILQSRAPLRFTGRAHVAGREMFDGEHLYMPLSSDGERVDRLIGATEFTYAETTRNFPFDDPP